VSSLVARLRVSVEQSTVVYNHCVGLTQDQLLARLQTFPEDEEELSV
jgi:hypothetical protein